MSDIHSSNLDKSYIEYHPDTWDEIKNFQSLLSEWIFRGQACSSWSITNSLERTRKRVAPTLTNSQLEKNIVSRFKRGAHLVSSYTPNLDNSLEWLALIQHYGGPTRLLDFTRSFYIAAFFAVETADSDAAIWCLNPRILKKSSEVANLNLNQNTLKSEEVYNHLIDDEENLQAVIDVEPFFLNERLIRQQGLFVMPCSLNVDFETCLFGSLAGPTSKLTRADIDRVQLELGTFYENAAIIKIIIPKIIHSDIRRDLARMNVDAANLFPGIDGFARSLNFSF
ncbi:MAG: FRG domain-containing protein [Limnohabitans sp.]|uniref:FRG domain-containing protein n=1 Tax=Limnohabitans sp. TaxID=1907725 RepID=UPI0025ED5179|nr:FRG domain-containing protein [Limnohabitans sp.]MCO4088795.1 FRG domain-containing protein [Limnohabitans sp.]